jgi:NitT/TauT family transport system substrate-binding protein
MAGTPVNSAVPVGIAALIATYREHGTPRRSGTIALIFFHNPNISSLFSQNRTIFGLIISLPKCQFLVRLLQMRREDVKQGIKRRKIVSIALPLVLALTLAVAAGCTGTTTNDTQTPDRIPELVLVGPPGPMAIPLAYLVENNKLDDIAENTELVIWENTDQLRAIVGGATEGHFVTMPSNSAALFYNKGTDLQLLDISVWGILYVVSTDSEITTIEDLKGKEVVVPFKGGMPDLLFNDICRENGIDTSKDLTIYYANTPQQAASLILSGEKDCAVLTEPLVTQVLTKGKASGMDIYRCIDLQVEWSRASGLGEKIPIAGTVALPAIRDNPDAIARFMEEYSLAVAWLKENPDEAGLLGSQIEQLGFEAKPVAESIKNTRWDFTPAKDCRGDIEAFFTALADQNPEIIGGKLPDDGFYYEGITP